MSRTSNMRRLRLSAAEAALIDRVRGSNSPGIWIRHAALWAAQQFGDHMPPIKGSLPDRRFGHTTDVPLTFRLRNEDLAWIDEIRGNIRRDEWIREVAIRAAVGVETGAWQIDDSSITSPASTGEASSLRA